MPNIEYLALLFSGAALLISIGATYLTVRDLRVNAYGRALEEFNQIISLALDDDEKMSIYDNLFYGEKLPDSLDGSKKKRWCYLRVLNVFERYHFETERGFVFGMLHSKVLDEMLPQLLANKDFLDVFKASVYSPEFSNRVSKAMEESHVENLDNGKQGKKM